MVYEFFFFPMCHSRWIIYVKKPLFKKVPTYLTSKYGLSILCTFKKCLGRTVSKNLVARDVMLEMLQEVVVTKLCSISSKISDQRQ